MSFLWTEKPNSSTLCLSARLSSLHLCRYLMSCQLSVSLLDNVSLLFSQERSLSSNRRRVFHLGSQNIRNPHSHVAIVSADLY